MSYSDPYVPKFPKMREYSFDLASVHITADVLRKYDCVLIATDHDDFDYDFIADNARLVVDTRGVYKDCRSNVIKA